MADILVGRGVRRPTPTLFDLISGPATAAQSALGAMGSAAKGATQATVGLPGDIESLVRLLTGGEQRLPTTEQVGQFVNQYIRAPYPQYEKLGEFTGLPTAGALTRPVTQITNEAADALVRAITRNPQATAPGVIQETAMPFMQAVYRQTTPLKPDPTVGTRFEREFMGGLAEKTPVKIEDLKGSSLMLMPWDSTSRNYKITSISDEKLATPVVTHGGQDYARDIQHIEQGVGGASNLGIAKRIKDRDAQARLENLQAGGTGNIIHLPTTMGEQSEFFSVMPTQAIFGLLDAMPPGKKIVKELDKSIREYKFPGEKESRLKNFKGLMTEEGRMQLLTGEGLDTTAGNARIAVMQKMMLKGNQEKLGFNMEDVSAALTDPALAGVPKGYAGNTVMQVGEGGMHLRPSINPTYNTDFTANYMGSLGYNLPAEEMFPKTFDRILQEMAGKKGSLRNMAIGAMEKRKEGVSEIVDQQVIDRVNDYIRRLNAGLLDQQ